MKLRLARLLALLLMVLPGRLVSLFPSSLLGAVGLAGHLALHLVRTVGSAQLASWGAARLGSESSFQPHDSTAAHQADLTVLLIPCVPAAQPADVTALLQAAESHAPHAALTAPGIFQVIAGNSQGRLSLSGVMVWLQG